MNEFSLIDTYFKNISPKRNEVVFGIGDDAACISVPENRDLLVSMDTLIEDVHFFKDWDAYDIAIRAFGVNMSDLAAMGADPCFATLALSLPELDTSWLHRFSEGLKESLTKYQVALVGGDTTKGPLVITFTVHGFAPKGRAITRCGAKDTDILYVSGPLGGAAFAVALLKKLTRTVPQDCMERLLHPKPRLDLVPILRDFATAAIDISDGLTADLSHILQRSQVGAVLELDKIPIHPNIEAIEKKRALDFALSGGDDYELCFTIPQKREEAFLQRLGQDHLTCYRIGTITTQKGLFARNGDGESTAISAKGYSHF